MVFTTGCRNISDECLRVLYNIYWFMIYPHSVFTCIIKGFVILSTIISPALTIQSCCNRDHFIILGVVIMDQLECTWNESGNTYWRLFFIVQVLDNSSGKVKCMHIIYSIMVSHAWCTATRTVHMWQYQQSALFQQFNFETQTSPSATRRMR